MQFRMSSLVLRSGDAARMPDAALPLVAARFAALADPLRLRLLMLLFDGEADVQSLATQAGSSHANVSRHLHTLHAARIVRRRKAGQHAYYAIDDPVVGGLCALTCASLERQLKAQAKAFAGEGSGS